MSTLKDSRKPRLIDKHLAQEAEEKARKLEKVDTKTKDKRNLKEKQ